MSFRSFLLFVVTSSAFGQVASPWESYLAGGVSAAEQKKFTAAEQLMVLALREAEHFGPTDARLGATLNTMGLVFMAEKKPREAEMPFRRALGIFEKVYGAKGLDVGNVCLNLGIALNMAGQSEAALPLLTHARENYEAILGKESPKTAQVIFQLGDAARRLHKWDEAEASLKRAADMQETLGGIDSPELATSLNSLALAYGSQGKYAQAEPLFKLSLNMREAKYGLNHEDVAVSLDNYASMLRDAGRFKDSVPLTTLAEAVRKSLQPKN